MSNDARTLAALWRDAVAEQRETPAYLVHESRGWAPVSWKEAATRVEELAHGLLALGATKGDRFAILAPSTVDWALLDFALLSIGAAVVPIYPTSSTSEVEYILENAEVRGIVCDDSHLEEMRSLQPRLPQLEHVLGFGGLDHVVALGRDHAATKPDAVA
jgi:long-chain acyl-CoA synthetase